MMWGKIAFCPTGKNCRLSMTYRTETLVEQLPIVNRISDRKYLWLTTAGHFTTDFYNGFLAPLLPIIVVKLKLSFALAGLLLSIFSISSSLLQPVAGLISDRLHRHYFPLLGPLVTALFMGFLGWVNQYGTLVFILVMSGIGTAMFHPPGAAVIGGLKKNRKGFSMSIFNTAGALGVSLGSLVIIPLTDRFGIKSTIVTVLPAFLFSIYAYKFFLAEKPIHHRPAPRTMIWGAIKPHRLLLLNLYLMVVIRATMVQTFSGFIPLYLTSKGEGAVFGGIALAIFQLFTTAGILVGGHLFDRIGTKKILLLSFAFVLPLALAFINFPSPWGLPFLALLGFLIQSSTSVNIILAQEIVPGQASFMSSIMMGLGWGLAGLLMTPIGAVADAIGLYWTLTLISFLSLAGLMLVYLFQFQDIKENLNSANQNLLKLFSPE